jgi:lysozyme family protein
MSARAADVAARMIDDVIAREGGYVNHAADRGGATKFGITHATLSAWRGEACDAADIRNLSRAEAGDIYRTLYFERPRIILLPEPLQPFVFDCAVHHGPRAAALLLQRVLNERGFGCAIDGAIGVETGRACAAAHAALGAALLEALINARLKTLQRIAASDPAQRVFLRGWTRRVESFRPRSGNRRFADGAVTSPPPT